MYGGNWKVTYITGTVMSSETKKNESRNMTFVVVQWLFPTYQKTKTVRVESIKLVTPAPARTAQTPQSPDNSLQYQTSQQIRHQDSDTQNKQSPNKRNIANGLNNTNMNAFTTTDQGFNQISNLADSVFGASDRTKMETTTNQTVQGERDVRDITNNISQHSNSILRDSNIPNNPPRQPEARRAVTSVPQHATPVHNDIVELTNI